MDEKIFDKEYINPDKPSMIEAKNWYPRPTKSGCTSTILLVVHSSLSVQKRELGIVPRRFHPRPSNFNRYFYKKGDILICLDFHRSIFQQMLVQHALKIAFRVAGLTNVKKIAFYDDIMQNESECWNYPELAQFRYVDLSIRR